MQAYQLSKHTHTHARATRSREISFRFFFFTMSNDNLKVSISRDKNREERRAKRFYETRRIHKTITLKRNGKSKWGSNLRVLQAKYMWRSGVRRTQCCKEGCEWRHCELFTLVSDTFAFPFYEHFLLSPRDNRRVTAARTCPSTGQPSRYDVRGSVRALELYSELETWVWLANDHQL